MVAYIMYFHKMNKLIIFISYYFLIDQNLQFLYVHHNLLINFMVLNLDILFYFDVNIINHIIFK